MVNLFFFFLLYLDYVLVYFTATLGLGRTGWEMQVTENEEMEKKRKIKVVLLAWLLILMDTNYMALLCFALLSLKKGWTDGRTVALNQVLRSFLD